MNPDRYSMQNAGFRALKPLPTRISSLFGVLGLLAAQQVAACENPVGRLETAESVVEMRAAASGDWVRIMPAHPLCEGDQVAVRAPGRASVVLEGDILVRLDQNTTLTLTHVPPDADARLGMVEGLIHVITRFRKRFEVNTPFVNAMVEGTEFSVRSADGAGRVVVIEGQVRVANAGGEQTLATGEAAIARGEHAPGKIELRALDTVRWAIHSSDVSTSASNSAFFMMRRGNAEPMPRTTDRIIVFPGSRRRGRRTAGVGLGPAGARSARMEHV